MPDDQTDVPEAVPVVNDGGYNLLEIMISIVLLGLISTSIMAGISGVIQVSQLSDDQARVSSVLGSASDRVANFAYSACPESTDSAGDPTNSYQSIARGAVDGVGWDPSVVTVVSMQYWQPGTGWVNSNGLGADCNSQTGLTQASAMQKITIEVVSESGKYRLRNDVVKTPVAADYNPANDPNNT